MQQAELQQAKLEQAKLHTAQQAILQQAKALDGFVQVFPANKDEVCTTKKLQLVRTFSEAH